MARQKPKSEGANLSILMKPSQMATLVAVFIPNNVPRQIAEVHWQLTLPENADQVDFWTNVELILNNRWR